MTQPRSTPRRIEVEIGSLVVDDPLLARPVEIAAGLERELTRLAAGGGIAISSRRPVAALSAALGGAPTSRSLGTAIACALGEELSR